MTNRVSVNPSIASIVDIDNIGINEIVPIYFTAENDWLGDFSFTIFNTEAKNDAKIVDAIAVAAKVITLTISPVVQTIVAGKYYYEIFSEDLDRIVFKGSLKIEK